MNPARILLGVALFLSLSSPFALADVIQRVSVTSSDEPATSFYPPESQCPGAWVDSTTISTDGRFVVFTSYATDLVPGDTNQCPDVFVRNRVANTTELVSLSNTGYLGNGYSFACDITADGRYVLFASHATNLVPGDTNGRGDLFVRDRLLGTTERVNVGSAGQQANDDSLGPAAISVDGRYVAFWDYATNLVAGDTNGYPDVFVRDRVAATTERVNVSSSGQQTTYEQDGYGWSVAISADGRCVAFCSGALNLVPGAKWLQVYLRDRTAATTELVSVNMNGGTSASEGSSGPTISPDGRYVMFTSYASDLVPGDTNGGADVFLRDRLLRTTERLSVSSTGQQGTLPEPSGFRWQHGGISGDGRYVVFESELAGLLPGETNDFMKVFRRDRVAGTTEPVAVNMTGDLSYGACPTMSADGRCIAFESGAADLVPGDTGLYIDAFVRDLDARFPDVPCCYWAFPHIEACVSAAIVHGYQDNTYQPKRLVTRDQMAVFISRALAGGDDNVPPGPAEATFADVPTDHWAFKYVEYCLTHGVVEGFDPTHYAPDLDVARDAMAVYLSRALCGGDENVPPGPLEATFDDVATDYWAYDYVEYCVAQGVVQGYTQDDPETPENEATYLPDLTVTRDQMAVYITRAFQLPM